MIRKISALIFVSLLLINVYGCILLAGAAGGAGTAVWLSGKLTQEVNAPFGRTITATESALKSLKLEVTKKTVEQEKVAQIMSKYTDGKTIWIDIRKATDASSRVDVRVGAIEGDKPAADKILKAIQRYL